MSARPSAGPRSTFAWLSIFASASVAAAQESTNIAPADRPSVHLMAAVPPIHLAPGIRVRSVVGTVGSFSLADFEPGTATVAHHHTREQANVGLNGVLQMQVDTLAMALQGGMLVLVPADVTHSLRAPDAPASMIEFHTVRRLDLAPSRQSINVARAAAPATIAPGQLISMTFDTSLNAQQRAAPGVIGRTSSLEIRRVAADSLVALGERAAEQLVFVLAGVGTLTAARLPVARGMLIVVPPTQTPAVRAGDAGLLLAVFTVSGESLAAAPPDTLDPGVLRPGRLIRLKTQDGATIQDRVTEVDRASLLWLRGVRSPVRIETIDSLWTFRTRAKTGAVVGASTLGFAAAALALAWCGAYQPCSDRDSFAALVGGGTVGAAIGGAVGALVGLAIRRWQLEYPYLEPLACARDDAACRPGQPHAADTSVAAPAPANAPQRDLCLIQNRIARCRSFVLTELALMLPVTSSRTTFQPGMPPIDDFEDAEFTWSTGILWNLSGSSAVGVSSAYASNDPRRFGRAMLEARFRLWLGNGRAALDASAGYGEAEIRQSVTQQASVSRQRASGYTASLGVMNHPVLGAFVRGTFVNDNRNVTKRVIHFGARSGSLDSARLNGLVLAGFALGLMLGQ